MRQYVIAGNAHACCIIWFAFYMCGSGSCIGLHHSFMMKKYNYWLRDCTCTPFVSTVYDACKADALSLRVGTH